MRRRIAAAGALFVLAMSGTAEAARVSIPTAARLAHRLVAQQRHERRLSRQRLGPARRTSAERVTFAYSDLNAAGNYRCRATIVVTARRGGFVGVLAGARCARV